MTETPKILHGEACITFKLDGRDVHACEGETIWQVAKREGVDIPHLCYSPEPGYRADGNCRACMVEIEGERVLAASCIRKPTEGMKVNASNHRAETARTFDLAADSRERNPREIDTREARSLFTELSRREWLAETRSGKPVEMGAREVEALVALGYTE